jgi:hypothetical protein
MSESAPQPSKSSESGANQPPGSGDGTWKLDLMSGTAWFSEWFYRRLQWPVQINRKRLGDLRPHCTAGAWEALMQAIRAHLERQVPLDAKISVQLPGGQTEWWRMQGSVVHNAFGKPMYLKGSVRDISAEQRPDADP